MLKETNSGNRGTNSQPADHTTKNLLIIAVSLIFILLIVGLVIIVILITGVKDTSVFNLDKVGNSSSLMPTSLAVNATSVTPISKSPASLSVTEAPGIPITTSLTVNPGLSSTEEPTPLSLISTSISNYKPTLPSPGNWSGPTLFGSFSFTVNSQRTGITYISYTFNNYLCGNVYNSGTIGKGQKIGWVGYPITNGKFTITGSLITIIGEFDPSGTRASGTWNYPECNSSGSWVASSSSPIFPQPTAIINSPIFPQPTVKINSPIITNTPKPTAVTDISILASKTYTPTIKVSTCPVSPDEKTYLCMTSEQGDWVGNGKTWVQVGEKSDFSARYGSFNNSVSVNINSGGDDWALEFAPLKDKAWEPGLYDEAQRLPFKDSKHPGIEIHGMGRGCNKIDGKFELLELIKEGSSGDVKSFAANFEQHCDGGPALVGVIRFNSTVKP